VTTERNGAQQSWGDAGKAALSKLAMGAGGGLAVTFLFWIANQPERVFALAEKWGPWTVLVFAALFMHERRRNQELRLMRGHVAAQEHMAAAITRGAVAQEQTGEALRSLAGSVGMIAQSQGDALEAIKASLGSLHGKVDEMRSHG